MNSYENCLKTLFLSRIYIMLNKINEVLQVAAATAVVLASLFMIRYSKRTRHAWAGIGFTICIFCYLLSESGFTDRHSFIYFIIVTGAISIPIFFWLLAKALFDDHFRPSGLTSVWFLVQLAPRYVQIYFTDHHDPARQYLHLISEVISIGFILAGLYTALKTRGDDLVDERLRFRNLFIITSAIVIGLTLIVEIATFGRETPAILPALQRCSIFGITVYFLLKNLEIRPGFFFKELPKQKTIAQEDPVLQAKLLSLLEDEKIYRKEGLTIRELADMMSEQEHRLRKAINGQLGFKNFNDFLNQYRIKEACEILSDPSQNRKTVLEIAYGLGYQSIGPFNKAFKEQKGLTPTVFRKTRQNS